MNFLVVWRWLVASSCYLDILCKKVFWPSGRLKLSGKSLPTLWYMPFLQLLLSYKVPELTQHSEVLSLQTGFGGKPSVLPRIYTHVSHGTCIGRQRLSYAAVAPSASKGFATIANERTKRKTKMKTVITASFGFSSVNAWRIHIGVMSIRTPMAMMTVEAKLFIRLSE